MVTGDHGASTQHAASLVDQAVLLPASGFVITQLLLLVVNTARVHLRKLQIVTSENARLMVDGANGHHGLSLPGHVVFRPLLRGYVTVTTLQQHMAESLVRENHLKP